MNFYFQPERALHHVFHLITFEFIIFHPWYYNFPSAFNLPSRLVRSLNLSIFFQSELLKIVQKRHSVPTPPKIFQRIKERNQNQIACVMKFSYFKYFHNTSHDNFDSCDRLFKYHPACFSTHRVLTLPSRKFTKSFRLSRERCKITRHAKC